MKEFRRIKRIYNFYANDLSYREIEKLVKQDVPELYDFFVRRMKPAERRKNSFIDLLVFVRNLFKEFLNLLSPIRRIIYSVALLLFIFAYFGNNWQWAFLAFILLNFLIAFELADKLTAKDELSVAREIQTSLMPKAAPVHPSYQISCYSEAAREVGGDYFDFFSTDNSSNIFFIVGDISGKGMAAAIHMVQVQSVLHHIIYDYCSPKEIIIALNTKLRQFLRKGSFFTASVACINPEGKIKFVRAGHMPLLYFSIEKNECFNIIPKGIGLGLSHNSIFENSIEEIELNPVKGDILLFYTDGLIELMNSFKIEFGEERLKMIIKKNSGETADRLKQILINSLNNFKDTSNPNDDITIIILKAE